MKVKVALDAEQKRYLKHYIITALACSKAPDGRNEWTLRMIADRVVELGHVEHLSYEAVRGVLKKVNSSPGRSDSGVSAK